MRPFMAQALAPVLDAQQQVVAAAQITSLGRDSELAAREVAAERWQEPVPRIYFAFAGEPTLLQRGWCSQLAGGDGSVVSGPLACHLLGVPDAGGTTAVSLVGPGCRRSGNTDYVVRRTQRSARWCDVGGVRVAEAPRAVLDACRVHSGLRDVRGVVCGALNAKLTTYDALRLEHRAEYRDGVALMGRALDDWADGARSAPEAEVADELRELVWRKQMPPFLLNPNVYEGAVLIGATDVYVPGCALGGETDSVRHHGSAQGLDDTLSRHADFERVAVRLEHVSPARFRRSPRAWGLMFAALAEERRALGDPPGIRIEPIGPLQPVRGRRRPR
jgi:hypothetical protein